jgi:hypothetical protein
VRNGYGGLKLKRGNLMFNIRLTETLYLAVILTITVNSYAQKMSPEDVIAKHLDSIGTKENRAKIKNQLILADIQLQSRGAPSAFVGKAVIFSASNKNLWGMNLNSVDYPTDRFGFNGKETRVSFIRPGVRSLLGGFVLTYNKLVEESLLGGALSSSWALLKLETKKTQTKITVKIIFRKLIDFILIICLNSIEKLIFYTDFIRTESFDTYRILLFFNFKKAIIRLLIE